MKHSLKKNKAAIWNTLKTISNCMLTTKQHMILEYGQKLFTIEQKH